MTYITTLDPSAITYGERIAVCARTLGEPLIPWQRQAADLINAVDPARPYAWRYPLVVATVPRQSGKSTLLRAVHLDRILKPLPDGHPTKPTTIWMTAQRGKDARRRFNDLANRVTGHPALKSLVSYRASIGSEALSVGNTGLAPFAPSPDALHGETSPFISVDEAWAFDEGRAAALLAAITPTQQNVPGSQLIVVSTAGTRSSRWLWSLIKAGRESLEDPTSRMAYLEFSADERYRDGGDGDPYSLDALDFHPAIGHITSAADIAALYPQAGGVDNIRRGFLNLWPSDMDAVVTRDMADYDAAESSEAGPLETACFAWDVATDRSGAAIYAATRLHDGRRHVELVESRPGGAWLAHNNILKTKPSYFDAGGYAGVVGRTLELANEITLGDLADATATLLAGIGDGTITVDGTPELRAQYEYAVTRPIGAGMIFDVNKSPGPIDHLRAAALAAHKLDSASTPVIAW